MATRALSFSRSLLTTKHPLSTRISRSYSNAFISGSYSSPLSLSPLSLLRLRPLVAVAGRSFGHRISPPSLGSRCAFSTRRTQSSLNDSNPNWTNRPPKETILLDGCDFEHWLVVMEKPEETMTRDDICDWYVRTLAQVVGSEEEARMKIYSVSTRCYFAFGALVSEELSYKIKELQGVRWVLPDSYLDVRNKDYGGEPFINGRPVPYDPKYHEEWERNNAKAMERNRRNDRPRNSDRSRNFERRRQNMQNPDFQRGPMPYQNAPPNVSPNMGGPGVPPNSTVNAPNMGGMHPNMGNNAAPNMGGPAPNHMGGMPVNSGDARNRGGMPPPPNMGGAPNAGWQGNMPNSNMNNARDFQNNGGMQYQNSQLPPGQVPNYQNSYAPNNMRGPPVGNTYNTRDMPGREMPPPPPTPPNSYQ
ncbi:hypothetical protein Dimus_012716 [Dionaea muscipula]